MNEALHKKIEAVLSSLDGMQRAEASPYLYSKIRNRMQAASGWLPKRLAWQLAVALFVVAVLNVATILYSGRGETGSTQDAAVVAEEYFITPPQTY